MQQLNPAEISEIIKQRIESLDTAVQARNEGTIVSVLDGIIRIHGLTEVMYGEMIEFDGGIYGIALNLERDSVGAVVLGDYLKLKEGQSCRCTGRILEVPVGPELEGRVVDALGRPVDGKGPVGAAMTDAIEKVAPGVIARQSVGQPVQTGLKSIDSMTPIGRGQRELIIGDREVGKTAVAIDTIINQKGKGPEMHLRRDRAEGLVHRQCGAQAGRTRRDGIHHRRLRQRVRPRRRCNTSPPIPAAPWASTTATAARTP